VFPCGVGLRELEQIEFLPGHFCVQTTKRFWVASNDCEKVNDKIGLEAI